MPFYYDFFFLLIIDFYFLIPAVITQIFNPTAGLVIPTGIRAKEAKSEMETHPIAVGIKISKCSIKFETLQNFYTSYSSIQFRLFLQ